MADNIYYLENYTGPLAGGTANDDGTGTDWIIVTGNYPMYTSPTFGTNFGAWIYMFYTGPDRSAGGYSLYPGGAGNVFNATFNGLIENAQGGGGSEHIEGNEAANLIYGDPIDVEGSYDQLSGRGGNDQIIGAGGGDVISGDAGDDTLLGDYDMSNPSGVNMASGSDRIYGGDGNDLLTGAWGNNTLDGGAGFDRVDYTGFFDDFGNYSFRAEIDAGLGTTRIYQTDLATGDEWLVVQDSLAGFETYLGTSGDDGFIQKTSFGIGETDSFVGGGGNDRYYMLGLGTTIVELAGGGRDEVFGYLPGAMPDNVEDLTMSYAGYDLPDAVGNSLSNRITGNAISSTIAAREGNDTVLGLSGNDMIWGEQGNDSLDGGEGRDSLLGNEGQDVVSGGLGRDWLYGNEGRDRLFGGDGDDLLLGQELGDTLQGGQGADTLNGGWGCDRAIGGAGADVFEYYGALDAPVPTRRAPDVDRIMDFTTGEDRIDLHVVATGQVFIRGQGFHGVAGEVRYNSTTGELSGDPTGDGRADWQILLDGAPRLVGADLIL